MIFLHEIETVIVRIIFPFKHKLRKGSKRVADKRVNIKSRKSKV